MKPIWFPLFVGGVLAIAIRIAVKAWPWGDAPYDTGIDFWLPLAFGTFLTIFAMVIAGAIAYGISSWIGADATCVWQKGWSAKMVSMRSSDGMHGEVAGGVFMVAGYVESAQTYFYYTLNDDGSYQPEKWRPDSGTSIFEETRDDGFVQQYTLEFAHPWVEWFGVPDDDRVKMEFHIPKGSIKQQFKLQ